jgi:3-deoxy-7-phosphoheptulonate synthase
VETEFMNRTENLRVAELTPLITPNALSLELPQTVTANETVVEARQTIRDILDGRDSRLLMIVGPCSIHDPVAGMEYAQRLAELRRELMDSLVIVMRVYFEKPRTTIGWKGLIYDPNLDGSADIGRGLQAARRLLLAINTMAVPTATEMLDPIVPQYLADLVSWASIGARTTESQIHRQMASGLSMPVGFKNRTDGDIQVAIEALKASRQPHAFLGIDGEGRSCVVKTLGNPWGHLILRGSQAGPNFDAAILQDAARRLRAVDLEPRIMVDCSHGNSGRRPEAQEDVVKRCLEARAAGSPELFGLMLESNLVAGSQSIPERISQLKYGVSITDACMGWDETARILRETARQLGKARPA